LKNKDPRLVTLAQTAYEEAAIVGSEGGDCLPKRTSIALLKKIGGRGAP
jgi:hypothetical protein